MAAHTPGNCLAELRQAAGLTQQQVADRLGGSQRRVSYHETGVLRLDALAIAAYAQIYAVDPAALFLPLCPHCGCQPARELAHA